MSLSDLQKSVVKELRERNVDEETTATIEAQMDSSQSTNLFVGLETTYLQTKYFKEHYNLLVCDMYTYGWNVCALHSVFRNRLQ